MMNFSDLETLKEIKKNIQENNLDGKTLQPIKEICHPNTTYFDIKICLALIEK